MGKPTYIMKPGVLAVAKTHHKQHSAMTKPVKCVDKQGGENMEGLMGKLSG